MAYRCVPDRNSTSTSSGPVWRTVTVNPSWGVADTREACSPLQLIVITPPRVSNDFVCDADSVVAGGIVVEGSLSGAGRAEPTLAFSSTVGSPGFGVPTGRPASALTDVGVVVSSPFTAVVAASFAAGDAGADDASDRGVAIVTGSATPATACATAIHATATAIEVTTNHVTVTTSRVDRIVTNIRCRLLRQR